MRRRARSDRPSRLLFALAFAVALPVAVARGEDPGSEWNQYLDPREAGWSDSALESVLESAREAGSAALFVVHRGRVLLAWGDVARKLSVHSIRKPLLGSVLGIHAASGALDIDATLEELDIDDRQPLTAAERRARVVDLLRGRSGVYHPAAYETPGKRAERPARGSHPPGTHFWSNNWDFNALLTIFERQTGLDFFDELEAAVARPIGMQDFRASDGEYLYEKERSTHPAYPLRMSARDLARFGVLILNGGSWRGESVVPEQWVQDSLRAHTVFGDGGGYTGGFLSGAGFGYMWWIYPAGCHPATRAALNGFDAVAAQGAGGHLVLLIPELELVFVHRAATDDGARVDWDALWQIADTLVAGGDGRAVPNPRLEPMRPRPLRP